MRITFQMNDEVWVRERTESSDNLTEFWLLGGFYRVDYEVMGGYYLKRPGQTSAYVREDAVRPIQEAALELAWIELARLNAFDKDPQLSLQLLAAIHQLDPEWKHDTEEAETAS